MFVETISVMYESNNYFAIYIAFIGSFIGILIHDLIHNHYLYFVKIYLESTCNWIGSVT